MRKLVAILLLATSAYAYDGIDLWRMGAAARQNNEVASGGAPASWLPTGVVAYFDFSVSATPTNEATSNITFTVVNNPGWSNAVPGRSGGAYWFEGTNTGQTGYQKLLSDTYFPGAGTSLDSPWFVAVTFRAARMTGVGDEFAMIASRGPQISGVDYGATEFALYGATTYSYFFTPSGSKIANQSASTGVWYSMIFKGVSNTVYSRFYGGSTVTGTSWASGYTDACTNRWMIGGSDYSAGANSQAYRGYVAKWAIGTALTESEETNLLEHLSQ